MTVDASNVTISTEYVDPVTHESVTVVDGVEVSRVKPTPEQSDSYAQAEALAKIVATTEVATIQADALVKTGELTESQLTSMAVLFPLWAPGLAVAIGDLYSYAGDVVECIQAHTTQEGGEPPVTAALWRVYRGAGEVAEWEQPSSTNPYMKGDRVLFNGPTFESLIDNNVWSPADYPAGWAEVAPA